MFVCCFQISKCNSPEKHLLLLYAGSTSMTCVTIQHRSLTCHRLIPSHRQCQGEHYVKLSDGHEYCIGGCHDTTMCGPVLIPHQHLQVSGGSKGGGGGAQQAPPLKLDQLWFFIQFFIRMLKNKAQIPRESIKTTPELPGPLSGPWITAENEFGSALVMCIWHVNFCAPPPPPPPPPPQMKILDPPLQVRFVLACFLEKKERKTLKIMNYTPLELPVRIFAAS